MKAVRFESFDGPIEVVDVPEPSAPSSGVVIKVAATGVCRSDWHGWKGHDADITPPHIPGHELAGVVHAVGAGVDRFGGGERVTVPFVCACGTCPTCARGEFQVCEHQTQPGFTHDGSFAEYVVIHQADLNVVQLPDDLSFVDAAALGCRFATAYRAVRQLGRPSPGDWVAVFGCGGVGLSAVHIAAAAGARVVAVDISDAALARAVVLGAELTVIAGDLSPAELGEEVQSLTGGATVSIDALGSAALCSAAILSLARRGRHVQVGLLPPETGPVALPMHRVIGFELEVLGSHGMAARDYPAMLAEVASGALRPADIVGRTIGLADIPEVLRAFDEPSSSAPGLTIAVL